MRNFKNTELRAVKYFFLQGKAPKEIHAILTETLTCFLPGWAKDLSAHLYYISFFPGIYVKYHIFSKLIRTLFTDSEG